MAIEGFPTSSMNFVTLYTARTQYKREAPDWLGDNGHTLLVKENIEAVLRGVGLELGVCDDLCRHSWL